MPGAWLLTSPQLTPVLPSVPSPAQAGSGLFPSFPTLSGRGGSSGSFWALWDRPQGPGHCSPVPPALFVSQLLSLELPGPWDAPGRGQHQQPGLGKAGVGTVTTPAQGCQQEPQGLEHPLQGTGAVPVCQPCTGRGTRSREGTDMVPAGISCPTGQGLWGLPQHCVVGGCSARGVSGLCQGVGTRLWCQGGGGG